MCVSRRALWRAAFAIAVGLLFVAPEAQAEEGVLVTFTTGTGDAPGRVTVTNAATGSTTSSSLGQKLPPEACANILSLAPSKIGLRADLVGASVRIYGRGVIVKVVGATITKTDLAKDAKIAGIAGRST